MCDPTKSNPLNCHDFHHSSFQGNTDIRHDEPMDCISQPHGCSVKSFVPDLATRVSASCSRARLFGIRSAHWASPWGSVFWLQIRFTEPSVSFQTFSNLQCARPCPSVPFSALHCPTLPFTTLHSPSLPDSLLDCGWSTRACCYTSLNIGSCKIFR